jgi:N-acetylglucosamine-6-sulfatase
MLGEHDYQDKRWMYEEAMRMPLLIRYPKTIKAGQREDAIVGNVDFAPTMLGFAGIKTPAYMQGRSFKSICETGIEPANWPNEAYYRYWMHMAHHDNPGHVGIRTKEYKLIYFYGADYKGGNQTPPAWELYDMKKDPLESANLYDNPKYAKTVANLKQRLASLRKRIGDDGRDFPETEKVVQEFWNYDAADREKARKISNEFLKRRLQTLNAPSKRKKK